MCLALRKATDRRYVFLTRPNTGVSMYERDAEDFEARYEIGATDYVCPAELSEDEARTVRDAAVRTWEVLGVEGYARVDLILAEAGEAPNPQVLEVNPLPGLTDTSLLPMAAEAAGISFEQLVERIVKLGLDRHRDFASVGS